MIISHKNKFIFIKTEKTAGTSLEIALSKYCGEADIITPTGPKDEKLRKEWGGNGPQNYNIGLHHYSKKDVVEYLMKGKRKKYYNHAPAKFIKNCISNEIWNSYYKFCFERNPYDKVISWYYFVNRFKADKPSVSDFVDSYHSKVIKGWDLYTINSKIVVNDVFKYEEMEFSLEKIKVHLGLSESIELPRAKSEYRKVRDYRKLLGPKEKKIIERVYAREIMTFGYSF